MPVREAMYRGRYARSVHDSGLDFRELFGSKPGLHRVLEPDLSIAGAEERASTGSTGGSNPRCAEFARGLAGGPALGTLPAGPGLARRPGAACPETGRVPSRP